MTFQDSLRICFSKYVDFTGRASRPEYWWFALFVFVVSIVLSQISRPLGSLFALAVLLPSLAAAARRLHDTARSGWWLLIALIPFVGSIILIVLLAQPTRLFERPIVS